MTVIFYGSNMVMGQFDTEDNLTPRTIWHRPCKEDNLTPRTIWHRGQFDTIMQNRTIWHRPCQEDNLTPRTIWHHHKFYISAIVWPRNMIRNILIATIYLFDWKLSCIMSLYQIRARQGPHIKTYLISWQLFGPKISLEIHCWPITTFFKTVGENFSQCQIVLFCMMVSNCPILHDGVKLS